MAVAATARASANAFIPTNDVDGCGIVKGERIGERFATAMMRDGATYGALGGAFALAGGAGCAALAKAADVICAHARFARARCRWEVCWTVWVAY